MLTPEVRSQHGGYCQLTATSATTAAVAATRAEGLAPATTAASETTETATTTTIASAYDMFLIQMLRFFSDLQRQYL